MKKSQEERQERQIVQRFVPDEEGAADPQQGGQQRPDTEEPSGEIVRFVGGARIELGAKERVIDEAGDGVTECHDADNTDPTLQRAQNVLLCKHGHRAR